MDVGRGRRLRQRMGITRVGTAVPLALMVWAAAAVALANSALKPLRRAQLHGGAA